MKPTLLGALLLIAACHHANPCTLDALDQLCDQCLGSSRCGNDPRCEDGEWQIDCQPIADMATPDFSLACDPLDGGDPDGATSG